MKKLFKLFIVGGLIASMTSCGSIAGLISKGKRPIHLMQAPKDLEVYVDGQKVEITSELFASTAIGNTTVDYYTAGVKLPYKKKVTVELKQPSTGKSATFELKPKGSRAIFWGNLFIFPVVGHIFDAVTKNSKRLYPYYIDVESALDGKPFKEWRNKGKLKRNEKKQIRKG